MNHRANFVRLLHPMEGRRTVDQTNSEIFISTSNQNGVTQSGVVLHTTYNSGYPRPERLHRNHRIQLTVTRDLLQLGRRGRLIKTRRFRKLGPRHYNGRQVNHRAAQHSPQRVRPRPPAFTNRTR